MDTFHHEEEGLSYDASTRKSPFQLYHLYVDPEYRFKGVATRFLNALCSFADLQNALIELEVGGSEENGVRDLIEFYSNFGFEWQDNYMMRIPNPQ